MLPGTRQNLSVRRSLAVVATLAVASALLVGCSSSKSSTSNGPAKTATGTPLVIGLQCSCSGPLASVYYFVSPVEKAWESYINSTGGIDGHPVKVILSDDALNPTTAVTEVAHLINDDHVIALADADTDDTLWAASAVDHGIPIIGSAPSSPVIYSSPDSFPIGETPDVLPETVAYSAVQVHATKLADFYCVEAPVCSATDALLAKAVDQYGVKLVYHSSISASQPSYAANCLAAKAAGAQAILVGEGGPAIQAFAQDCSQQGYHPRFVEQELSLLNYPSVPGMDGAFFAEPVIPYTIKNNAELNLMYSVLKQYAPGVTTNANFSDAIVLEWASLQLFALGAKAGHLGATPTTTELKNGLWSLKNETVGGLSAPVTYSQQHGNSIRCFFELAIQNGQYVAPVGTKQFCINNPSVLEPPAKV